VLILDQPTAALGVKEEAHVIRIVLPARVLIRGCKAADFRKGEKSREEITLVDASGRHVPGLAAAAKQMGRYVGRLIVSQIRGDERPPPFHYRDNGELATIGRKSAVVALGRMHFTGLVAWLFWSCVHIYFLIGLRNRFVVALRWLWAYVTFQRSAWLIIEQCQSSERLYSTKIN
jgi:hypothetical protein